MALMEREKSKSSRTERPKSGFGGLNAENTPDSPLVAVLNRSLANGFVPVLPEYVIRSIVRLFVLL